MRKGLSASPALEAGVIEMTRPDKPNSQNQHYRLTAAGRDVRRPQESARWRFTPRPRKSRRAGRGCPTTGPTTRGSRGVIPRHVRTPGDLLFRPVFGAGHGIRTRDIQLGKLALYQLS